MPKKLRQNNALERERARIDKMLIEAVESGATILLDDAEFARIRQACRDAVKKPGKKPRKRK